MERKTIFIKGARENNLKNIDLEIPKNALVVFTGLSGSGKTTLAFDTIYSEGQRRYVESLSSYARQFLGNVDNPMSIRSKACHPPSQRSKDNFAQSPFDGGNRDGNL
jgi:excinuclease ABC subunit A